MTLLALVVCFTGCGSRMDDTVSKSSNGMITDNTGKRTEPFDAETNTSRESSTQNTQRNDENERTDDSMMDKAGDAVRRAGEAMDDVISGDANTSGTGMTGSR